MGIDWTRRTEEKFRHRLQGAKNKALVPSPLFTAEEDISLNFPCHWVREDYTLPLKTRLTIFQRSERSRIAVLYGNEAVAEVRGEAAKDLKALFRDHPELCNALAVRIVRLGKPSEPFYVQPIAATRRDAAA
jgi:hypothetical protein